MKLIIHDLTEKEAAIFDFKDNTVISDNGNIKRCTGCFGCWVKTPGQCIIHDGYENLGKKFSECDQLIIISKCVYGSYSPFIKNVLDRSISYVHPFFEIRKGEMHHKRRYANKVHLVVYMYGGMTDSEKETAEELVKANALNLNCESFEIHFAKEVLEFGGELI
ncbi:hypothetical protein IMSAG049_01032 [Clostridiales bacterium]|nr:hypothetical protein IMSAG049_01032 [Clostridiales bacterium]